MSDTTAIPETVLSGYQFYNSSGQKVSGTYIPLDTSDATAKAMNIEQGKTAYVNGIKITGTAYVAHTLIKYTGNVDPLSEVKTDAASTTIGDYMLIGGGAPGYRVSVETYDKDLTKSMAPNLGVARTQYLTASHNNIYALFTGGVNNDATVDAYNSSLTRSNPIDLDEYPTVGLTQSVSFKNYVIFYRPIYYNGNLICCYNDSLTKQKMTQLTYDVSKASGTSIGDYALIGGGFVDVNGSAGSYEYKNYVNRYDINLTKSNVTNLQTARSHIGANSSSKYAIFFGGHTIYYPYMSSGDYTDVQTYYNITDTYNTNLVKSTAPSLTTGRSNANVGNVGDWFLIAGGTTASTGASNNTVEYYNDQLSKGTTTQLQGPKRNGMCCSTINDQYCIFAAGEGYANIGDLISRYDYVDVYTLT